ncbi:hypothetical protein N9L71_01550 [Verrucomicrobiales bacterium]|nr:hypothetical protein [Verrucomicrobiales bacterium]
MPRLPSLDFSTTLDLEEGHHDKVELRVGSWEVEGSQNEIDTFRQALASDEGIDTVPWHGAVRWFRAPSNYLQTARALRARTGKVEIGGGQRNKLLFAASATFSKYRWGAPSATRTSYVNLRLFLNLTRLIRYQRPDFVENWQESWEGDISEVRLVERELRRRNEYSLDGKDNWLPNIEFWQESSRADSNSASPQLYLDAILSAWESEAERAAGLSGAQFIPNETPQISLQKAETYWEFAATDPCGAVKMLTYPLERYSAKSSVQDFPVQQEMEGNSRSLLVNLRTGESLRVYAKTNRRVRFEVVYKLSGDKKFRHFGSQQGADLSALLDVARDLSFGVLSHCISYLDQSHSVDGGDLPPFRLISDLIEGSETPSAAYDILTLLIHNRRIVRSCASRLVPSLDALKRKGVLVMASGGSRVAAEKYERGLELLRKEASRFPASPNQNDL